LQGPLLFNGITIWVLLLVVLECMIAIEILQTCDLVTHIQVLLVRSGGI